ncbi:MAG: glucuronate isomerase [Bacteroidetes bacterium]|nr:MAG: glucuronate isomerase [Bacteroidota bacterium]
MKPFLNEDFLLQTATARTLYHEHARHLPIIDYHCHLPPAEIAQNRQFENLTRIWLEGDHYKWRAMRTNGVDERYCTGDASDYEKFEKWAETVPFTMRNPLYHWTHMELRRPFGVSKLLNPDTAREIYTHCTEQLQLPEFSAQGLMKQFAVEVVCTTDDPADTLEHHLQIREQGFDIKVLPTFRPDKCMMVEDPPAYNAYLDKLGQVVDQSIDHFIDLLDVLKQRIDYFHQMGGRLSDHGLETIYAEDYTDDEINYLFHKVRLGHRLEPLEVHKFKSAVLVHLGQMYHEKGWTQQFHLGALRNNNSRMMRLLGPDTGFDSIGDFEIARPLARFLDRLDTDNRLPQTILYNLNPRDNEVMATMAGNFNDGSIPGKVQFGSAWWFLDQKDGMEKQMNTLSNMGLLSRFVGMLTDSRSFLSYPRHDYFRRILCNLIGNDVENGELPHDLNWLGQMVEDICYYNAKDYFKF